MADLSGADLKRLQETLLEILEVIDAFCSENGITYFLDGGTALGARRHKGFIPWDDDIDIGMPREDYDRFLMLAEHGLPEGYSLHTYENTPGYCAFFAKVYKDGTRFETAETIEAGCPQCIFVDVFPYDRMSSDPAERATQMKKGRLWQSIAYLEGSKAISVPGEGAVKAVLSAGCFVAHYVVKFAFGREKILRNFEKARLISAEPSDDWNLLSWPMEPLPGDLIFPTKPLEFEGKLFPCPGKIEEHLTFMYGPTWNELPPEEKRHTHAPLVLSFGD